MRDPLWFAQSEWELRAVRRVHGDVDFAAGHDELGDHRHPHSDSTFCVACMCRLGSIWAKSTRGVQTEISGGDWAGIEVGPARTAPDVVRERLYGRAASAIFGICAQAGLRAYGGAYSTRTASDPRHGNRSRRSGRALHGQRPARTAVDGVQPTGVARRTSVLQYFSIGMGLSAACAARAQFGLN